MSELLLSTTLNVQPRSLVRYAESDYALVQTEAGTRLALLTPAGAPALAGLQGEISDFAGLILLLGPLTAQNAAALRHQLPWLRPQTLGKRTSAGMGDRLGLATPGHVRALQSVGGKIAPIFAQQSIREMSRTNRTPQEVMDDAIWGMFSEGWQGGAGADADHLKTTEDIDVCLAAGYTLFTIDPGAYVDNRAITASLSELRELAELLPPEVQPPASGLLGKQFDLEGLQIIFDEITLLRAAVKYGRAMAHVTSMYRHLVEAAGQRPYELEVSVDETEQPTTHAEHLYIASELIRLGVEWVSLAPRYIGRFEKGTDYIGDPNAFEADMAGHAAIARHYGGYKLSLHSGSDKFSIYPAAMRQTQGLVHLKTAGTSYLEALRTIAPLDPALFCEIYNYARQCYPNDRASYHVSAELARAPLPESVSDFEDLLEQFDAREILHVTFGSVLTAHNTDGQSVFYERLIALLQSHPEAYASNLEKHFIRHLLPFTVDSTSQIPD